MNLDIDPDKLKLHAAKFIEELDDELLSDTERLTIYLVARDRGGTERAARMYAMRQPPADRTSDQWWKGNEHFSKRMGDKYAEEVKAILARQGVHMGPWDDYDPGSAKFKGDADAVIKGHQGPRERLMRAQRLLAQRQAAIESRPDKVLAEDIVRDKFEQIAREHPEVTKASAKEKAEIRRGIIKKHGYHPERAGVEA
jgi:hypothetical protein